MLEKNPKTDEMTRWDIEGVLIKLTDKHGHFDEWDH